MRKRIASPTLFCLFLCLLLALPAWSWGGSVMITKGSTLLEGKLEGLVTIPGGLVLSRMEIDVASWGVNYGGEDFIVYDPAMAVCSRYQEALILNLPRLDEVLTSVDGKSGSLIQFLSEEPYVVYDTDLRMIGVMGLYPSGAPYPLPSTTPPDTTPPDTMIIRGPSGTITERNVSFSFSGSDNRSSRFNLVYACFLEGYDAQWSDYTSATSKSYNNLLKGAYTFHVRAKDEAQNVDPTPASRSFTVAYFSGLQGDVNNDDAVNLLDAIRALQVCAGLTAAEEIYAGADVDEDGKIGMAEVIYILQKAAELR